MGSLDIKKKFCKERFAATWAQNIGSVGKNCFRLKTVYSTYQFAETRINDIKSGIK